MPKPQPTARERIERAFHVSFKLPEQAAELLDAYRDQVLTEAAQLILADAQARYDRSYSDNRIFHYNGGQHAVDTLLAARTSQEA